MRGKIDIFLKIFFLLSILVLALGLWDLRERLENFPPVPSEAPISQDFREIGFIESEACDEACKKEIARLVSEATATISGQTVIEREVVTTAATKQTSYISLGSSFTATNTDWVEVPDSAVYIDAENDFSKEALVSWEASLKVAHGNGKAFARLYDDTNKIAVDFSEISTENNSSFKQVSSGNLPLWKGRNLYKVQIKSLNSFEITVSGARVKITY